MNTLFVRSLALALVGLACAPALAALQTEAIVWSGASFGNSARATGTITFETALFDNGPHLVELPSPDVTALTITITGASAGNGTFHLGDFAALHVGAPSSLDFSAELIGQPLSSGQPFGSFSLTAVPGSSGDFNLLGRHPEAPSGTWYFGLNTAGGQGDPMKVTSMTPVPEPETAALLLAGLALVSAATRRRRTSGGRGSVRSHPRGNGHAG